jgi:hypothetical protein
MTNIVMTPRRILPSVDMVRVDTPDAETMRLVNRQTLRELAPEDVHVRRAFVVHDAVDTEFSRFTAEALSEVARLMPGVPVLSGHGKHSFEEKARTFRGERLRRDGVQQRGLVDGVGENLWVAADFYWMRGRSDAEDLALDIDGGIKREKSLRWAFEKPVCSICREDMRECDHMPGELYAGKRAWYDMHGIRRVAEWSFVPRGGQLGTELQLTRQARGAPADWTAAQVVDRYLEDLGATFGDEDRDGLIEFARCYAPASKRTPKQGWFSSLRKRAPGAGTSWWRKR